MLPADAYDAWLSPPDEDRDACDSCEGRGEVYRARRWWTDERGQDCDGERVECRQCEGTGRTL